MFVRKYIVLTNAKGDEIITYIVSDAMSAEEWNNRPSVAEFPISQVHDKATQRHRARVYCEYMNKIAEATEQAYEQIALIDILKS